MRHQRTRRSGLAVVVIIATVWGGGVLAKTPKGIVHVPTGKPVMVDGKIGPGEWSDAEEVKIPSGARLYIKVSGEFVYVAVQFPARRSGFTDIYIASED